MRNARGRRGLLTSVVLTSFLEDGPDSAVHLCLLLSDRGTHRKEQERDTKANRRNPLRSTISSVRGRMSCFFCTGRMNLVPGCALRFRMLRRVFLRGVRGSDRTVEHKHSDYDGGKSARLPRGGGWQNDLQGDDVGWAFSSVGC